MENHTFGNDWTEQKLICVKDYAASWAAIMEYEKKKWGWKTHYIDAFSGSGTYSPKKKKNDDAHHTSLFGDETEAEKQEVRAGSAQLAIKQVPKFDRVDLIEINPEHASNLRSIAGDELNKRVFVHEADVNKKLCELAKSLTKNDRALLFLDPYGCQVWWETLQKIAATEVVDVWYLFSIMGINRKLTLTPDKIPPHEREILNKCLGTDLWEKFFYKQNVDTDLFGEIPKTTRKAAPLDVERFFQEHLGIIFPTVSPHCLRLKNKKNGHMFSLYFAISNPHDSAKKLALKLANPILKRWENSS